MYIPGPEGATISLPWAYMHVLYTYIYMCTYNIVEKYIYIYRERDNLYICTRLYIYLYMKIPEPFGTEAHRCRSLPEQSLEQGCAEVGG